MRAVVLLVGLCLSALAWAHKPVYEFGPGIYLITDGETSLAFYRTMDEPFVHVYQIPAKTGRRFHVGLNIPAIEGLETYNVWLAIVGPGLDKTAMAQLPDVTAVMTPDQLQGLGARILPPARTSDFFEKFTRTRYWGRQYWDGGLPETADYFLVVWQPEAIPGKYVLDTGYKERFGLRDLAKMPKWLIETRRYFKTAY